MSWARPEPLLNGEVGDIGDKPVSHDSKLVDLFSEARGLHAALLRNASECFKFQFKSEMQEILQAFGEIFQTLKDAARSRYNSMLDAFFDVAVAGHTVKATSVATDLVAILSTTAQQLNFDRFIAKDDAAEYETWRQRLLAKVLIIQKGTTFLMTAAFVPNDDDLLNFCSLRDAFIAEELVGLGNWVRFSTAMNALLQKRCLEFLSARLPLSVI